MLSSLVARCFAFQLGKFRLVLLLLLVSAERGAGGCPLRLVLHVDLVRRLCSRFM